MRNLSSAFSCLMNTIKADTYERASDVFSIHGVSRDPEFEPSSRNEALNGKDFEFLPFHTNTMDKEGLGKSANTMLVLHRITEMGLFHIPLTNMSDENLEGRRVAEAPGI
ncbi:hypothetical protein HHI36_010870 [Cryptolaemus montrouzieri]|uniref:Uncharacterized protein n=1 Tax=Cryptolaemus montrouzieri TaxID=559131 RepID=A0ABD2MJY3_9CUCU